MKNLSFLLFSIAFSSCATLSTYQTARVLNEGEMQVSGMMTNTYSLPADESDIYDDGAYIMPSVMFRKGLGNDREMGVEIAPASINIDYKKLIKAGEKIIISGDIGIGYFFLAASEHDQTHIVDLYPSFLITFDASEKIDFTVSPKLIIRYINSDAADEFYFSLIPGITFAPSIGRKIKAMPEGGFYYDVRERTIFTHFGVAISF